MSSTELTVADPTPVTAGNEEEVKVVLLSELEVEVLDRIKEAAIRIIAELRRAEGEDVREEDISIDVGYTRTTGGGGILRLPNSAVQKQSSISISKRSAPGLAELDKEVLRHIMSFLPRYSAELWGRLFGVCKRFHTVCPEFVPAVVSMSQRVCAALFSAGPAAEERRKGFLAFLKKAAVIQRVRVIDTPTESEGLEWLKSVASEIPRIKFHCLFYETPAEEVLTALPWQQFRPFVVSGGGRNL